MGKSSLVAVIAPVLCCVGCLWTASAAGASGLANLNHIVILMQENHSFDNYLGALALVPGSPYHKPGTSVSGCPVLDHACVDGLHCTRDRLGSYLCSNFNLEGNTPVFAFHDRNYCPAPDLDHEWTTCHQEANFSDPNNTLVKSLNNGFVRVNDATEQFDNGVEGAAEDDTMGFYDERDLPYYYALAQTFALDDRYFCPMLGPTTPNRFYLIAATSFGHLISSEAFPPPPLFSYRPITGTILDLLDANNVSWVDYYSDLPQAGDFRHPSPPHFQPLSQFFADAAAGALPQVALVDPELNGADNSATDEHPPHDIRAGESYVAQVVDAVREGPNWKDSIVFITYDESGGFYDHVPPAKARQAGASTPDGIAPGQCADLSNPPASTRRGQGGNCADSQKIARQLCPAFTATDPYPARCASFNQLGFRVPLLAVSPFAKPHYVSHTVGDHTSLLALIERRFLSGRHLTQRDANANPLEDMFDFNRAPSLNSSVPPSVAPAPNLTTDGNGSCAN